MIDGYSGKHYQVLPSYSNISMDHEKIHTSALKFDSSERDPS